MDKEFLKSLCSGLPLDPLPENRGPTPNIAHNSKRPVKLTESETKVHYSLLIDFAIFYKTKSISSKRLEMR